MLASPSRLSLSGAHVALAYCVLALTGSPSANADTPTASASNVCGSLANHYGPFDYRPDHFKRAPGDQESHAYKLNLVGGAHFTPQVEALLRGQTAAQPGHDMDYTLRVFPNHHRVLAALLRLSERSKLPAPAGLPRPIECYFERATRFAPNDPIVRLLYASFLIKQARTAEARPHIESAQQLAGDNPFSHYNIGLVYLEAGDHAAALKQAHRAMALGFPRQELKQGLVAAGKWSDPPAEAASQAEPTAAPASKP